MKESEITSLAREYAEEYTRKKYPNAPGHVRERIIEGRLEHMEGMLPWLLRRYCLVEKSKIKEVWSMITGVYLDHDHITYDGARYLFNEVLFPEIAKEVEG